MMRPNDEIQNYVDEIRDLLLKAGYTLSIAESVTCGCMQRTFANTVDASRFFQGGITCYNLGQKVRHLGVEPIHAELHNCVSEQVAGQMALGVTRMFSSMVGISITGYAQPLPEKGVRKIFAWYGLALDGILLATGRISSRYKEPEVVQADYCRQVLKSVLKMLRSAIPDEDEV